MTVRVLIADDQEMVRTGFAMILAGAGGFAMILAGAGGIEVVAECGDGLTALTAIGRTDVEICDTLHIDLGTVKSHLTSIPQRLGARNPVEIAARAWESGVTDP